MDAGRLSGIVVIMLLPTLMAAAVLYVPGGVRALHRVAASRRAEAGPRPAHPPIEQLAADLRRLLHQHDALRRSTGVAMRAHHLFAVEGAISDCAIEAAGALGLPCPDRRAALSKPDLRRLLRSLGEAGLVLPATSSLLGAEGHR